MSFRQTLVLAAGLSSTALGHMLMTQPEPYNGATLTNGPMDNAGTDFPCKVAAGGTYAPPAKTLTMPIGAEQTLILKGEATHGGGSCQISLTKDLHPTKDSKWMVIHSIEGGCPNAAPGNMGSNAEAIDPTTFPYKIPEGIAPGEYALAWTWFNKVGNREMYMNCAPIKVTSGSGKRSVPEPDSISIDQLKENHLNETMAAESNLLPRAASFPDMFKANLAIFGGCGVPESTDLQFPNPGQSVVKGAGATLGAPTGSCGAGASAGGAAAVSGSGSSGSATAPQASAAAPAPPAGTATILASPSAGASGPSAPAPAAPAASPSAVAAAPAAPAPAASGSTSGGSAGAGGLTCSADGKSFTLAGSSISMPVALGTKCVASAIAAARRARF